MAQVNMQPPAASPAIRHLVTRQFVARIIISSISSAAGLISFVITGPVMCRIAAVDPALEGVYLALIVGWFWSLARMWSLTFEGSAAPESNFNCKPNPTERRDPSCNRV